MSGVPYTFGTATTSIPLSNLDSNFVTPVTIGNASVALGNTITVIGNLTLTNPTIIGGTSNVTSTSITNGTSNVTILSSGGAVNIATNGTTAITVDTSQNVGIGTSSPTAKVQIFSDGAPASSGNMNTGMVVAAAAGSYAINIGANSSGAYTWINSAFQNNSGTASPLAFMTGATERMRIDSSGNLLVGTTVATGTPSTGFVFASGSPSAFYVGHSNGTATGNLYVGFCYNSTNIGSITQNGTTGVLYNLTSDYRLKDNPVPLTGASDFIMALQPKSWDWWDGSGKGVGFIAHEFMEVAKHSGNGEKDAVDAEGKPVYQSIQPSSSEVMANLVALMQEQQALIESLTTRLTALENK